MLSFNRSRWHKPRHCIINLSCHLYKIFHNVIPRERLEFILDEFLQGDRGIPMTRVFGDSSPPENHRRLRMTGPKGLYE